MLNCNNSVIINAELYEQAIKYEKGSFITSSGALATLSGAKTGRAPKDKRVVKDEMTEQDLWWGKYVPLLYPPSDNIVEKWFFSCSLLLMNCVLTF